MGNDQPSRTEPIPAPQRDIEVKHARAPTLAVPAAEIALDTLEGVQHFVGLQITFDERYRIGEISSRAAMGRIEDDRRSIEQPERLIQPRNCSFDDTGWCAKAPMSTV